MGGGMGYWDYDRGIHSPIPYQAPDSLVILDVAPAMIRNDSPRRLSVACVRRFAPVLRQVVREVHLRGPHFAALQHSGGANGLEATWRFRGSYK